MSPPPEFLLQAVGCGVLVPALVTWVVLWLTHRWGPSDGGGLASGLGLLAGFVALAGSGQTGWTFLRLTDSWDWLLPLAVMAIVAGIVERMAALPVPARWGIRLLVAATTAWLVVRAEDAVVAVHPGWYPGLGLAILVLWGSLDRLGRRWAGSDPPILLATVALANAGLLELAGSLKLAQMGGVLASVLGGIACFARRNRDEAPVVGAVPALSVLLPGLLFTGFLNTFSEVPSASFLLVLASPLVLGATAVPPLSRRPNRWPRAIATAATLVAIGLALTLAARA